MVEEKEEEGRPEEYITIISPSALHVNPHPQSCNPQDLFYDFRFLVRTSSPGVGCCNFKIRRDHTPDVVCFFIGTFS